MGWTTEDGLHEGYLVPQFVDGQRAVGVTGGGIPDDQVASGPEAQAPDGTWSYPTLRRTRAGCRTADPPRQPNLGIYRPLPRRPQPDVDVRRD